MLAAILEGHWLDNNLAPNNNESNESKATSAEPERGGSLQRRLAGHNIVRKASNKTLKNPKTVRSKNFHTQ